MTTLVDSFTASSDQWNFFRAVLARRHSNIFQSQVNRSQQRKQSCQQQINQAITPAALTNHESALKNSQSQKSEFKQTRQKEHK